MIAYLVIREGSKWTDVFRLIPGRTVTVGRAPTNQIVIKDLRLQGSFGYGSGAFRRFPDALSLIEENKLATKDLITHRFNLEEIQQAFDIQLNRNSSIKVMIIP